MKRKKEKQGAPPFDVDQPKKHGGARPNSGPMPKSAAGVRRMFSFRVDPENLDFLRSLSRGTVADFLNALIKSAR